MVICFLYFLAVPYVSCLVLYFTVISLLNSFLVYLLFSYILSMLFFSYYMQLLVSEVFISGRGCGSLLFGFIFFYKAHKIVQHLSH